MADLGIHLRLGKWEYFGLGRFMVGLRVGVVTKLRAHQNHAI